MRFRKESLGDSSNAFSIFRRSSLRFGLVFLTHERLSTKFRKCVRHRSTPRSRLLLTLVRRVSASLILNITGERAYGKNTGILENSLINAPFRTKMNIRQILTSFLLTHVAQPRSIHLVMSLVISIYVRSAKYK